MAEVPSPPLRKIESLKLIAELERRGVDMVNTVVGASTDTLMEEITRRSSAALCMSYCELGERKGWTLGIRGVHAMGPILQELLFSEGLDELLDGESED